MVLGIVPFMQNSPTNYFELTVKTSCIDTLYELLNAFEDIVIEETQEGLKIYADEDLAPLEELICEFGKKLSLQKKDFFVATSLEQKPNSSWIEEYKKGITPIEIEPFYIHPSWCEPKSEATNIQIDPTLAFGTGHHYTTHSMVRHIIAYVKPDDKLLDVGTGSGILSIVASKMGANIACCDTDENAIAVARENFATNGVVGQDMWCGTLQE